MSTASATVSRWSRGFVAASALWLVCWQVATLAVAGVAGLAAGPLGVPDAIPTAGAVCWTLAWTIRDNPTGAETGTGKHNASRRRVDRLANAAVPVAFAYLAAGAYATVAGRTALPLLFDGYPPRASHLLAAGMAALLLFAVGFRLLPRFLVALAGAAGHAYLLGGLFVQRSRQ